MHRCRTCRRLIVGALGFFTYVFGGWDVAEIKYKLRWRYIPQREFMVENGGRIVFAEVEEIGG
jgi:hypothetical protein